MRWQAIFKSRETKTRGGSEIQRPAVPNINSTQMGFQNPSIRSLTCSWSGPAALVITPERALASGPRRAPHLSSKAKELLSREGGGGRAARRARSPAEYAQKGATFAWIFATVQPETSPRYTPMGGILRKSEIQYTPNERSEDVSRENIIFGILR